MARSEVLDKLLEVPSGSLFENKLKKITSSGINYAYSLERDEPVFASKNINETACSAVRNSQNTIEILSKVLENVQTKKGNIDNKEIAERIFSNELENLICDDASFNIFCKKVSQPEIQTALLIKEIPATDPTQDKCLNEIVKELVSDNCSVPKVLDSFLVLESSAKNEKLNAITNCFNFFIKKCLGENIKEYRHLIYEFFTKSMQLKMSRFKFDNEWNEKAIKNWMKIIRSLDFVQSVDGLLIHFKQIDKLLLDRSVDNIYLNQGKEKIKLKTLLYDHKERMCEWYLGVSAEIPFVETDDVYMHYVAILQRSLEKRNKHIERKKTGWLYWVKSKFILTKEERNQSVIKQLLAAIARLKNDNMQKIQFKHLVDGYINSSKMAETYYVVNCLANFQLMVNRSFSSNLPTLAEKDPLLNFEKIGRYHLNLFKHEIENKRGMLEDNINGIRHKIKYQLNKITKLFDLRTIEDEKNMLDNLVFEINNLLKAKSSDNGFLKDFANFQKKIIELSDKSRRHWIIKGGSWIHEQLLFFSNLLISPFKGMREQDLKESYSNCFKTQLLHEIETFEFTRNRKPLSGGVSRFFGSLRYRIIDYFGLEKRINMNDLNELKLTLKNAISIEDFKEYLEICDRIIATLPPNLEIHQLLSGQIKMIENAIANRTLEGIIKKPTTRADYLPKTTKEIIHNDANLKMFYCTVESQLSNEFAAQRVISTRKIYAAYSNVGNMGYGIPMLASKLAEKTGIPGVATVGSWLSSGIFMIDIYDQWNGAENLTAFLADPTKSENLAKTVATHLTRIWEEQIKKIGNESAIENVQYFASCAVARMMDFLMSEQYLLYPGVDMDILLCAAVRLHDMHHGFWENRFVMKNSSSRFSKDVWCVEDIFRETKVSEGNVGYTSDKMSDRFGYARDGSIIAEKILHLTKENTPLDKPLPFLLVSPAAKSPARYSFLNPDKLPYQSPAPTLTALMTPSNRGMVAAAQHELNELRQRVSYLEQEMKKVTNKNVTPAGNMDDTKGMVDIPLQASGIQKRRRVNPGTPVKTRAKRHLNFSPFHFKIDNPPSTPLTSDPSVLGERKGISITDNNVIQHSNLQQGK